MIGQCCGTCRWRKRGKRCALRRGQRAEAVDGKTCHLWDPIDGEKVAPEPWRRGCSSLAFAAESDDQCGDHMVTFRKALGAAMEARGIPRGTRSD